MLVNFESISVDPCPGPCHFPCLAAILFICMYIHTDVDTYRYSQ